MNKEELIDKLSIELPETKGAIRSVVNAAFLEIAIALCEGDEVRIPHFGIFRLVDRAERSGQNPIGGEFYVPAHKGIRFFPSSTLRNAVK